MEVLDSNSFPPSLFGFRLPLPDLSDSRWVRWPEEKALRRYIQIVTTASRVDSVLHIFEGDAKPGVVHMIEVRKYELPVLRHWRDANEIKPLLISGYLFCATTIFRAGPLPIF
jgi:hypothetical protein